MGSKLGCCGRTLTVTALSDVDAGAGAGANEVDAAESVASDEGGGAQQQPTWSPPNAGIAPLDGDSGGFGDDGGGFEDFDEAGAAVGADGDDGSCAQGCDPLAGVTLVSSLA